MYKANCIASWDFKHQTPTSLTLSRANITQVDRLAVSLSQEHTADTEIWVVENVSLLTGSAIRLVMRSAIRLVTRLHCCGARKDALA
jgi:hypothetical protein